MGPLYLEPDALMQATWESFYNPAAASTQFINLVLRWS